MKKVLKQICKFSVIGVMAFLVDYTLLFWFTESMQMHYLLASMLSFSVATIFNYICSTKYVFECRQAQRRTGQFTIFILLSGCGLFLNSLLMKTIVENMHLYYMFAKLISAVVVSIWNFTSRKVFLEEGIRDRISSKKRELGLSH